VQFRYCKFHPQDALLAPGAASYSFIKVYVHAQEQFYLITHFPGIEGSKPLIQFR
jgi:hypothetical protein